MEYTNSLSLVHRHDGSYFYIKEIPYKRGLYKYVIADWQSNKLGKPIIVYSHTKRSKLSKLDKEYFDNNFLSKKRLEKYLKENLYIGGISKINGRPVREFKENIIIKPNYKAYIRESNYIIIELNKDNEIKEYSIYEFINRKTLVDFEVSYPIYSEKDLLNLKTDEKEYVMNSLLKKQRVEEKIEKENGYVGTIMLINGKYKKVASSKILKKEK